MDKENRLKPGLGRERQRNAQYAIRNHTDAIYRPFAPVAPCFWGVST